MANAGQVVKCGYCNYFLGSFLNNVLEHSCFHGFDPKIHAFYIDDNGMITMTDQKLHQNEPSHESCSESQDQTLENFSTSEQKSDDEIESSIEYSTKNIQAKDFSTGLYDEYLIGLVQKHPALYDHRLPVTERTKLKKKDIWITISNNFQGEMFTPSNAEKRWNYLRDNYLKARKKFLEAQYKTKKSGSAATSVEKPTYRYYQLMDFLNEPVTYKTTISSLKLKSNAAKSTPQSSTYEPVNNIFNNDTSNINDEWENQSVVERETSVVQSQKPSQSRQALSPLSINISPSASHTSSATISPVPAASQTSGVASSCFPVKAPVPISPTPTNSKKRRMSYDIENQLVQMLQKESKECDEVDGILMQLGAGLRRLNYQTRARLEIKFLQLLNQEEENIN